MPVRLEEETETHPEHAVLLLVHQAVLVRRYVDHTLPILSVPREPHDHDTGDAMGLGLFRHLQRGHHRGMTPQLSAALGLLPLLEG